MQSENHRIENEIAAAELVALHSGDQTASLAQSRDEVIKEYQKLISAGEELLKASAELSGHALAEAREQFAARLGDARLLYQEWSGAARLKGREAAAAADGYVHAHPWPAIGMAAGLALVLSALAARRTFGAGGR